jgi:hypothetical protein
MIVNTSFFYGNLYIAQITEASVQALVNDYINRYEPQFLQSLMGYGLYKKFIDNPTDPIYVDIINGKEYTNTLGRLAKWEGLKLVVVAPVNPAPGKYRGPIANYIWYNYIKDNNTQTTALGEKAVENGEVLVSPYRKMVKVWNEMVKYNESLVHFLEANKTLYPDFSRNYISRELVMFKNPLF